MMKATHYAKLEEAIEKWVEECCDEDGQVSEFYIGNRLVPLMASAARSVFEASEDGQEYAERNAPRKSA